MSAHDLASLIALITNGASALQWAVVAVAVALLVVDWQQTLRIFGPMSIWRERNPAINALVRLLGAPAGVHAWFATTATAGALLLAWAHRPTALVLLAAFAVAEAYWVRNNWRNGIRIG